MRLRERTGAGAPLAAGVRRSLSGNVAPLHRWIKRLLSAGTDDLAGSLARHPGLVSPPFRPLEGCQPRPVATTLPGTDWLPPMTLDSPALTQITEPLWRICSPAGLNTKPASSSSQGFDPQRHGVV